MGKFVAAPLRQSCAAIKSFTVNDRAHRPVFGFA